jgi:hypothetical protein
MQPHRSGITARQHQAGSGAARRAHGAEDIGRAGTLIMRCPGPYRVAPSRRAGSELQRRGSNPDHQRLLQIPGIGPLHALTVLAEAGDCAAWLRSSQATPFIPSSRGRYRAGELLSGLGREGALARACRGYLFCAVITRMTQQREAHFKVLERKLNKVLASPPAHLTHVL